MTPRCPDCPAVTVGNHLEHVQTCPLGNAIDDVMADDRDWFARRPHADQRWRHITLAEVAELRAVGLLPEHGHVAGKVQVVQLEPGVRVRRFGNIAVVVGSAA